MVLPEAITKPVAEVAGDVDDALSGFKPYEALKTTFDPATTKAEEVTGELGALFGGGLKIASVIGKAAPVLKTTLGGAIPTVAGFTASDIIVTDKNQNLANDLIDAFPSTKGALETLAINPDDADSIKLLKKAGEGVGIGGLTEGAIKAIAFGYKALKGKNKAIVEDDILTPPKDDSGTITDVEVKELSDGSYQQKINIRDFSYRANSNIYKMTTFICGYWKIKNNVKHSYDNHYKKLIPKTFTILKNCNIVFFYDDDNVLSDIKKYIQTNNIIYKNFITLSHDLFFDNILSIIFLSSGFSLL